MRVGADERYRTRLGLTLLLGLLVAVTVIGAVVPWLVVVDSWRLADRTYADVLPGAGVAPRLVVMADNLPFVALQSGYNGLPAVTAALGVVGLARMRRGAVDAAVSRAALVVTAVAAAAALAAALTRLVVNVYAYVVVDDTDQYAGFVTATGLGRSTVLLAPAMEILAWLAVILALVLFRPGVAADDAVGDADDDAAEDAAEDVTGAMDAPAVDAPGPGDADGSSTPPISFGPAHIRADGASDSGYDEFRFRR